MFAIHRATSECAMPRTHFTQVFRQPFEYGVELDSFISLLLLFLFFSTLTLSLNRTTTQRNMKKGRWRWRRQTATTRKHWRRTSYAWTAHQHVFQWHLKAVNILKVFLINNLYMYLRSASVFFFVAAVFIANGCSCFRFDIHSHPHKDNTTIRGIREHEKVMANVSYNFFLLRFGFIYYLFVGSLAHTWCDGKGRSKHTTQRTNRRRFEVAFLCNKTEK